MGQQFDAEDTIIYLIADIGPSDEYLRTAMRVRVNIRNLPIDVEQHLCPIVLFMSGRTIFIIDKAKYLIVIGLHDKPVLRLVASSQLYWLRSIVFECHCLESPQFVGAHRDIQRIEFPLRGILCL